MNTKQIVKWYSNQPGDNVFIEPFEGDPTHYSLIFDDTNGYLYFDFFDTKKQAVDHLMNLMNCNKTITDYSLEKDATFHEKDNKILFPFFIEEKDGKLYEQWVYYEHSDDNEIRGMKTIEELRTYIENGNTFWTCGKTRAPVSYSIGNRFVVLEDIKTGDIEQIMPLSQCDFSEYKPSYRDSEITLIDTEKGKEYRVRETTC